MRSGESQGFGTKFVPDAGALQYPLALPPAAAFAHRQPFLAIEPVELLPVHRHALALQQKVKPAIAEASALGCRFPKPLSQVSVVRPARTIAVDPRLHADESARMWGGQGAEPAAAVIRS